jgi:diguanylate cyclase (GGDEF)-like protein
MIRSRGWVALAAVVLACTQAAPLRAQAAPTAELEAGLARLSGPQRASALAELVDRLRLDAPGKALAYGAEALAILQRHPDPAVHVSVLNEMGWAHMTLSQYDSATAYMERGLALARRTGERGGEARALSNLGTLSQRRGDPLRAIELFRQAMVIQRAGGSPAELANSLNNLGFVYSTDLADYQRSLEYHRQALTLREKIGDSAAIALSLNNIGIVHGRLSQHDRAVSYFERALAIRRQLGNQSRVAATLSNLGDVQLERGDLGRALAYQREAMAIRRSLNDRSAIALSHRNLGMVYLARGELNAARAELVAALKHGDPAGDRGLAVQTLLGLASLERSAGRPGEAEAYARRALALAEQMGSREMIRRSTGELARAYEVQGKLQAALDAIRRSQTLSDSIFTAETASRIAGLERRVTEEQRAREMERLRRREAVARVQAAERAAQRNAVLGAAVLLGMIGLLLHRRRGERARLAEVASVTDALTGVGNRRFLEQSLPMDVAASLRRYRTAAARGETPSGADLVVFLLDLDHFKGINDRYGHAAGDQVLASVADTLQAAVRDSDLVVRWGGEEFVVLARFVDRAEAAALAERIRALVEARPVQVAEGVEVRVTCSIGFAPLPFDPAHPDALGWQEVLSLADAGAYEAKRRGRNGWVGYFSGEGAPLAPGAAPGQDDIDALVAEGRIVRVAAPPAAVPLGVLRRESAVA